MFRDTFNGGARPAKAGTPYAVPSLRLLLGRPANLVRQRGSVRGGERVGAFSSLHALTLHARFPVRRILCAIFTCCVSFAVLPALGQVAKEYDLKAAFLCKF